MKSFKLLLFVAFISFFSSVFFAVFAMHPSFEINHPSCIALVLNGVACPTASMWDYLLFHLNSLKKISNFIPIKFYNSFFFLFFISLLFFLKVKDEDNLKSILKALAKLKVISFSEIIYLKKFYHWLSLHEKSGEALNN